MGNGEGSRLSHHRLIGQLLRTLRLPEFHNLAEKLINLGSKGWPSAIW
jgi:hypothetical protein